MIKTAKQIHFIGIGGIGISTLAQMFNEQGKVITGSDIEDTDHVQYMINKGINIKIGHNERNLSTKTDLVIYSYAIEKDNPELVKAKNLGMTCLTYPEALGELTKDYYTIGITGTHGKSTTTSMVALMLEKAGYDPTVVVGTKIKEFDNKNYRIGKSKYLVVEACEFRNAFLNYKLDILAIINIDSDHLDFFKTQDNYIKAFNEVCKKVDKNGLIIKDGDDKFSKKIEEGSKAQIFTISNSILNGNNLVYEDEAIHLKPDVPGKFNIRNSAFAAVIGKFLGIENVKIEKAISEFKGSWRRMELKELHYLKNTKFYDDYGHLPAEIDVTLRAIREKHPTEKILAIFQPHQFIRIRNYLKEFGMAFSGADGVLITDILRNRDTKEEMASIDTDELVQEIKKHKSEVFQTTDIENTAEWIKKHGQKYTVMVAMGSGNIKKLYKLI